MKTVEIRRRRPEDGEIERLARVTAEPGQPAEFDYLIPEFREGIEVLIADPIVDARGRVIAATDGEAYVAALPEVYRGSRFWAEEVREDELE
ncbi:MAG: hypothetical protein ACR2H0_03475 [Candidatus Limnocylindrales bacterium]